VYTSTTGKNYIHRPKLRTTGQIQLRYPGRRQVRSWSQTCSELEFGLLSSSLAAS